MRRRGDVGVDVTAARGVPEPRADDDPPITKGEREFARWLIKEAIREWREEQEQDR